MQLYAPVDMWQIVSRDSIRILRRKKIGNCMRIEAGFGENRLRWRFMLDDEGIESFFEVGWMFFLFPQPISTQFHSSSPLQNSIWLRRSALKGKIYCSLRALSLISFFDLLRLVLIFTVFTAFCLIIEASRRFLIEDKQKKYQTNTKKRATSWNMKP